MESLFTYTTMTLFQCYKIVLIYSLHINFFKKNYYYENNQAFLMLKNLMFLWGILNCTTINQNRIDFATFDITIFDVMLTIGQIHRNQFDVLHFQWLPFMREKEESFRSGDLNKGPLGEKRECYLCAIDPPCPTWFWNLINIKSYVATALLSSTGRLSYGLLDWKRLRSLAVERNWLLDFALASSLCEH